MYNIITPLIVSLAVMGAGWFGYNSMQPEPQFGLSTFLAFQGGTGTSTKPVAGDILMSYADDVYGPTALIAGTNITLATSTYGELSISAAGGGGGAFPFTADTNYGVQVYSTSTPSIWLKSGVYASSTSHFVNASTTLLSATTLYGALVGNADTATNLAANGANCSAGNSPLGVDTLGAVESCFDVWTEAENTSAGYGTGTVTSVATTWPILGGTITDTGTITFGGLSTSTAAVVGNIPYFSGVNTFANVATGTVSGASGITVTAGRSAIGGALTITCTGADTDNTGCLSDTDWDTFNGKQAALGFTPADETTTITIAGTANQITSSAGAQDLSTNRTWTLSFADPTRFTNASTTNLSVLTRATFGSTATSSFNSAGLLSLASGGLSLAGSTITDFVGDATISLVSGALRVVDVVCTDCLNATEIEDIYLLDDGDTGTGVYDFGGTTSFEITNAAAPTVDATGEMAWDTTSGNLVLATSTTGHVVLGSATTTLFAFTMSSTSLQFVSGGDLRVPTYHLPEKATAVICSVVNGTSQQIFLSDGTNDTNTVTCTTTETQFALTTNNSWNAYEAKHVEFVTKSGTPDYITVRVLGYRTTD